MIADWRAFRRHLAPNALIIFDDIDERHDVWRLRAAGKLSAGGRRDGLGLVLRRLGCVRLSGIADDERRAQPLSSSSGFCVATARWGISRANYTTTSQAP